MHGLAMLPVVTVATPVRRMLECIILVLVLINYFSGLSKGYLLFYL